jgi:hypothetical protein
MSIPEYDDLKRHLPEENELLLQVIHGLMVRVGLLEEQLATVSRRVTTVASGSQRY